MTNKKARKAPDFDATKYAPWNGDILQAEVEKPGGQLMGALMACSKHRGHNLQQLGAGLGVTYGYLSQLRSGLRDVNCITEWFARKRPANPFLPT